MIRETDIAKYIQPFVNDHKSVLDIGCRKGSSLFPFLELNFELLHGIDIDAENKKYTKFAYLKYKKDYQDKVLQEKLSSDGNPFEREINKKLNENLIKTFWPTISKELDKLLEQKRVILSYGEEIGDFFRIELNNKYDIIIVSNFLHFYDQEKRNEIISKVKLLLNPNGILYFTAKHIDKFKENRNYEYLNPLGSKLFEHKSNKKKYYFLDDQDFELITNKFIAAKKIENCRLNSVNSSYLCFN